MTDQSVQPEISDTSAGDEDQPRILDDEIVREHLDRLAELAEQLLTDVDQLSSDLDDNRLAIGASVAWLVGDNSKQLEDVSTLLRARLTWLAGQGLFPLIGD